MTTAVIEPAATPHVYTALAAILASLSVDKNGTLPSNMGGKPYITAVDVAKETKRMFVENNLIFVPRETVFKHESIVHKDRVNIAIVVTGEYTIISTQDGSSVTVSGTGDGLAGGTAVASNIASTNALKNALLRTFLITEQSVEDAAKKGEDGAQTPTQQALSNARQPPAKPAQNTAVELNELKEKIRGYIGSDENKKNDVNKKRQELIDGGSSGLALHKELVKHFKIS